MTSNPPCATKILLLGAGILRLRDECTNALASVFQDLEVLMWNCGAVELRRYEQTFIYYEACHQAVCPPSIRISAAVIYELAGDIKKTAAPLKSSGLLSFPSMFCFGHSSLLSGNFLNNSSTMAVTIYPGDMVLTRMLYSPHSEAKFLANCKTPAFEALYAGHIRP